jgi:hypothetical protein
LVRHGKKFYQEIRKRRKYYRKGYLTRKTRMRLRKKCGTGGSQETKPSHSGTLESRSQAIRYLARVFVDYDTVT